MTSYYKQGEDCLTLNIWRNISNTNIKKTSNGIYSWWCIWTGGPADLLYERTSLINSYPDIILVTINYRIGILGYNKFIYFRKCR